MVTGSLLQLLLAGLLLAGCGAPNRSQVTDRVTEQPRAPRTLAMAIRVEPTSVAAKAIGTGGVTLGTTKRLVNADLTIKDAQGAVLPYLAEVLPQLNSETWRVLPEGRMETTYRLKPDLIWHDGHRLTASDFVFSWQVYATPELGTATSAPIGLLEEVVAPDDRTVFIRWRRPFADAGILGSNFPPLPRHLLEAPLQQGPVDAFINHPYWTREFVGLGPYRVERWEPGVSIEAIAFDRHVWGRPRIDRIRITFIGDPNTALANLLAGEVQLSADDSIRFQQGATLRREWGPAGGSVLLAPSLWRATSFQFRPELVNPPGLLDPRVRRALAHAVDKDGLMLALFEGEGITADLPIPPGVSYYAQVERSIEKTPYDARRTQQLMGEAGYRLGGDGTYTGSDGRMAFELKTNASSQNEIELSIMGAGWRQMGFDVREAVLPAAQAQDSEVRATFPGLYTFSSGFGESALAGQVTSAIPRAENRWAGGNRGAWSNPQFDRLADQFTTALDRAERDRLITQMAQIFHAELPIISLHFNAIPVAFTSALTGPRPYTADGTFSWNVHEWELR